MGTVKVKENGSVRLWQLSHAKLVLLGIAPNQADWLVKQAEGFAKSTKEPLAARNPCSRPSTQSPPHNILLSKQKGQDQLATFAN